MCGLIADINAQSVDITCSTVGISYSRDHKEED